MFSSACCKTEGVTLANVTNLPTALNARPSSSTVHSKTEVETMIANLISDPDINLNTLNEIANAINTDPVCV